MAATWDPTRHHETAIALSNGDLIATNIEASTLIRGGAANLAIATDEDIFFCVKVTAKIGTARLAIGVGLHNPVNWNAGPGQRDGGAEYINTGAKKINAGSDAAFGDVFGLDDIICVAYKHSTREIWFAKNNVWQGGGDPNTGSNPAGVLNDVGGDKAPGYSIAANTEAIEYLQDPPYAPPTGFTIYGGALPGSGKGKGGSSGKGGGRGSGKGGPGKKKTNQGRASNSAWSLIRITNV